MAPPPGPFGPSVSSSPVTWQRTAPLQGHPAGGTQPGQVVPAGDCQVVPAGDCQVSQAKLNQEQERAAVLACLQSLWPGALLLSQAPGALGDRGTRGGRTPGGSGSPQPSLQKRPGSDSLGCWLGASAPPTGQLRPAPPGPPPALPADLSGPRATRAPLEGTPPVHRQAPGTAQGETQESAPHGRAPRWALPTAHARRPPLPQPDHCPL